MARSALSGQHQARHMRHCCFCSCRCLLRFTSGGGRDYSRHRLLKELSRHDHASGGGRRRHKGICLQARGPLLGCLVAAASAGEALEAAAAAETAVAHVAGLLLPAQR